MESQPVPCDLSLFHPTTLVLNAPLNQRVAPHPETASALLLKQGILLRGDPYQKPALQSLDWPLALQRAANQAPLARELFQLLLNFLPQVTLRVQRLLRGGEEPDILDWVHKLHGGTLYSGVPRLSVLCYTLESQLRQGTAPQALIPEWLALLEECTAIEQAAIRW